MTRFSKSFVGMLLLCFLFVLSGKGDAADSDEIQTPSQKTKEAIQKFQQAPKQLGKGLDALKERGKTVLQKTFDGEKSPDRKASGVDLEVPEKRPRQSPSARFSPIGKRDPFRPPSLRTKENSRARDHLSPLERYELGQLKIVGIVWDVQEPKAMVEDSVGLGYIVKVGTAIGSNEGKIKIIKPNEIIVEEIFTDFYGARKKREVRMKLASE